MAFTTLVFASATIATRDQLFDDGWKFYRGDVPVAPPPPPPCPASAFPLKVRFFMVQLWNKRNTIPVLPVLLPSSCNPACQFLRI